MKFQDSVEYAVKSLRVRSLRSWLTIIGVIIGVIAMVVITSVTEGVSKSVTDLMANFGTNTLFVIPINIDNPQAMSSFSGGPAQGVMGKLYQRDVDSLASVPGVKEVSRLVMGRASLQFKDKELSATIMGSDSNMFSMFGDYMALEKGRLYTDSDRRVVMLGNDAANKMFGRNKLDVGSILIINGKEFRVIGIFKKIGSALSTADDSNIYVPFEDGRDLFKAELAKNEVSFMYAMASEGYDPEEIKSLAENKITSNHKVSVENKDFSVITSEFIKQSVGDILGVLSQLLFAITAVSTVVGGIGISNTMFMSVMERVREIGILKSTGATERDIQLIFLTESALIGFIGGALGFIIAYFILVIAEQFGVPYLITPMWVAFVFIFSVGVGVIAGYIPSRQASRLDPVQALGY